MLSINIVSRLLATTVHHGPAGSCFRKASVIVVCWTHDQSLGWLPQVEPKGDLVLVEVAEAEAKTTGGVLLPTAAQKKPTSGAAPQRHTAAGRHACLIS